MFLDSPGFQADDAGLAPWDAGGAVDLGTSVTAPRFPSVDPSVVYLPPMFGGGDAPASATGSMGATPPNSNVSAPGTLGPVDITPTDLHGPIIDWFPSTPTIQPFALADDSTPTGSAPAPSALMLLVVVAVALALLG